MKIDKDFIKAKNMKGLSSFSVFSQPYNEGYYFRLSFNKINKFTDSNGYMDVQLIPPYTQGSDIFITRNLEDFNPTVRKINFTGDIYAGRNNFSGFFAALQKNVNLTFEIMVNNDSNLYRRLGLVCHQLYGIVNKKRFLLFSYVGEQNEASPIQFGN